MLMGSTEFVQDGGSPCNFCNTSRQLRASANWFAAGPSWRGESWKLRKVEGTTQEIRQSESIDFLDHTRYHMGTGSVTRGSRDTRDTESHHSIDQRTFRRGRNGRRNVERGRNQTAPILVNENWIHQPRQMRVAKSCSGTDRRNGAVLKRAGRYLLAYPRVVQPIPMQRAVTESSTFCHADHAGCSRRRKSTAGAVIMFGEDRLLHCFAQCRIRVLWLDNYSERIAGLTKLRNGSRSQGGVVDSDRR